MISSLGTSVLATLLLIAILLAALVATRPGLLLGRGGRVLSWIALFLLPVACLWAGVSVHMESSKTTNFCLSCHVMEPYGESLLTDDEFALPASHFQNRRIGRATACFTCHTQYTMFGDYKAKINGLKHLIVYYRGKTPEKIELYDPYENRECLHCHAGARLYQEMHEEDEVEINSNELSCLECHDISHEVESLDSVKQWKTLETLLQVKR